MVSPESQGRHRSRLRTPGLAQYGGVRGEGYGVVVWVGDVRSRGRCAGGGRGVGGASGVDVGLGEGVGGGVGGVVGCARSDRRVGPRDRDATDRVGDRDGVEGDVAGVGHLEGVGDQVARIGDAVRPIRSSSRSLTRSMTGRCRRNRLVVRILVADFQAGRRRAATRSRGSASRRRRCRPA